jgi:2-phosphosulfolactate phosphatase
LGGESGGQRPPGFEADNSPAELSSRSDTHRPLILVSSSGTKVIHAAADCKAVYLACFRNHSVLARYLAEYHSRVAIIGAGTHGEFREEDQICCAWIAAALMRDGYRHASSQTAELVSRWQYAAPRACLCSRSVDFLIRTGRLGDLDYILNHVDDLQQVFAVQRGEVNVIPFGNPVACHSISTSDAGNVSPSAMQEV